MAVFAGVKILRGPFLGSVSWVFAFLPFFGVLGNVRGPVLRGACGVVSGLVWCFRDRGDLLYLWVVFVTGGGS